MKSKPVLEGSQAVKIALFGCAFATERNWDISICVVDDGGHILALHRMDAAAPGTAPVAAEKARSAALFRASTKLFEDFVASGKTAMLALPGSLPIQGGVPIRAGQTVIGAVGVSGVQSHEDEEIALSAIAGLAEDDISA
jgi:glc operon protein GlcG